MPAKITIKDPSILDTTVRGFFKKTFRLNHQHLKPSITIQKAIDSLGNEIGRYEGLTRAFRYCRTNCIVISGDMLSFSVLATSIHPSIEYALDVDYKNVIPWQKDNTLSLQIRDEFVSKFCQIRIRVRIAGMSQMDFTQDNTVIFSYLVRNAIE